MGSDMLRGGLAGIAKMLLEVQNAPKTPCHKCGRNYTNLALGEDCPDCMESSIHERRIAEWREKQVGRLPWNYREASFSSYRCPPGDRAARDLCEAYAPRRGGEWLYLTSQATGTGKTHLACALALRWLGTGRGISFTGESELLTDMRATFNSRERTGDDPQSEAQDAPFLVLDDLGTSNPTPWASEVLFVLLDGRMKAGLPTVLTSNFQIPALGERIGGEHGRRIVSRLHSACRVVSVRARDYRVSGT